MTERIFINPIILQLVNKYTRLEPKNKDHSIEEGIQARVKDPLWFLGRQWQLGEFRAENGGHPVRTEISFKTQPLNKIVRGSSEKPFNLNIPLEMMAEDESIKKPKPGGPIPPNFTEVEGWDPGHLEYSFNIKGGNIELSAEEYDGNQLDWYSFKKCKPVEIPDSRRSRIQPLGISLLGTEQHIAIPPSSLKYRGMPYPRWWTFEDYKIDVANIKRPYLNYLSMILMQFSLMYSNDWFYIPIDHKVGCVRKITRFDVMDSFGIVSNLKPVVDPTKNRKGWEVFTLSNVQDRTESDNITDGSLFYMPNNLDDGGLESQPIEEVSILRDELANLVWAIEHKYQNDEGDIKERHDEEVEEMQKKIEDDQMEEPDIFYWDKRGAGKLVKEEDIIEEGEPGNNIIGPLAKYELMSYVPPHWIPYVARQITSPITQKGEIILRRGRTKVNPTELPQHKGELLKESTYIFEEEVPRTGILLKRVWQLTRDVNGNFYSWLSRKKSQDMSRKSSGLRFDYLIRGGK